MKIAVGSKNPVKIASVKEAFELVWPEEKIEVVGIEVSSGVSSQPMGDEETIQGAINRAQKALDLTDADFGVGPEGGLQQVGEKWFDTGWIVILRKDGKKGIGSTIRLEAPPKVMELIHKGEELGTVCDILFQEENSKQAGGFFGLVTKDIISRKSGYRDGVIAALAPFISPEVFGS